MDSVTRSLVKEFSDSNNFSELGAGKQFEHFAAFSILFARFPDEIATEEHVVGDGGDLNIDAYAVKVNGRLVLDAENVDDLLELNGSLDVEFIIIQAKSSDSFDGAAILALGDNLAKEVFSESPNLPVNDDVRRFMEIKNRVFENAAKLKDNPICRVFYACTGNWKNDDYLTKIIDRKRDEILDTNLFSEVSFEPLGARELQQLFRRTKTSISRTIRIDSLVTLPTIKDVEAAYLGILPASEFLKLLIDDDGDIMKSVFVDNVRDFQGQNPVNLDIAKTIQEGDFDQFVLRNNGITIVAKSIRPTSSQYRLEEYQIVNGCQTSHVIYENKEILGDGLFVPVKLIHTEDEEVAQAIVKSTNKQTLVDENDLLAFTPFQHGLEDFYGSMDSEYKLYYERRGKQFARTEGIEKGRIVTKGIQLKTYASMFCDLPHQAGRYQGTLLKTVRDRVFREDHRPDAYYTSAFTNYRFEIAIRRLPIDERVIRSFKFYLLLAFRYRFERQMFPGAGNRKSDAYCRELLENLGTVTSSKEAFDECVSIIQQSLKNLGIPFERDSAKSRPLVDEVMCVAKNRNPIYCE
ncbi:AIPR family protein [Hoeflea prorocentri]|uniref:AIPR family protein n=1 Tax=Hoeflea prorocentri TaxID=1922333 RepID=A0A9X3UGQ5_9HYPH|nr:AIPR family protein [Hoeflea prorocentri]MCY6380530.1 AIPR family protein [Hoeflea prorocentri]MDA5398330.1 AIPR family protein [Hoeflea prorocentri]